jgi:sugar phosphate isomerase/epimerase
MLKTGINFQKFGYSYSDLDTMKCMRDAGFDSFFTSFMSEEDTARFQENAERAGLEYESIHAPFRGLNCIWDEGEKGDRFVQELMAVADTCKKFGIGYFTLHCMNVPQFNIDVSGVVKWSQLGLDRFRRVVDHAGECGVKACFENVEFPQFEMKRLMDTFRAEGHEALGFTWDIGHEHCYPAPDFDVAEEFGDLLVGTHIHDNFGQANPHVITWNDDAHILPFDGTVDFRKVARSLKKCGYQGTLTVETGRKVEIVPWYRDLPIDAYFAMIHEKLERIAMWYDEA